MRLISPSWQKERAGCGKRLAPGQWFEICGETDMGQTAPALCTECGGPFRLEADTVNNDRYPRDKGRSRLSAWAQPLE
jgi:hypothetical protein